MPSVPGFPDLLCFLSFTSAYDKLKLLQIGNHVDEENCLGCMTLYSCTAM